MNLLHLPETLPTEELVQQICTGSGVRIERIISTGQTSPEDFWYNQQEDEWIVLLQGEAVLQFEEKSLRLSAGDSMLIPANCKHRVKYTSTQPPCVWLCVFGNEFEQNKNDIQE